MPDMDCVCLLSMSMMVNPESDCGCGKSNKLT